MKNIKWFLNHFEEVLSTFLVIIVFITLGFSIVGRWIGISTSGLQEIYKYSFIGTILFGISLAAKENEHIRADIITGSVADSTKEKMFIVADIIWFLFSLGLAWYSFLYVISLTKYVQTTPILSVPIWLIQTMVPISALLTAIRIAQNHIKNFFKLKIKRSK